MDFMRGAALSEGGKPIIALPSTAAGGNVSRIVSALKPGAGVVTTRGHVHWVVTEHGAVNLHGLPLRKRGRGAHRHRPPGLPRRAAPVGGRRPPLRGLTCRRSAPAGLRRAPRLFGVVGDWEPGPWGKGGVSGSRPGERGPLHRDRRQRPREQREVRRVPGMGARGVVDRHGFPYDRLLVLGAITVVVNVNLNLRRACRQGDRLASSPGGTPGPHELRLRPADRVGGRRRAAADATVTLVTIDPDTRRGRPLPEEVRPPLSGPRLARPQADQRRRSSSWHEK